MALQSQLFRGDPKLEAAAVSDPAHVTPGSRGEHVRKIQQALIKLDGARISDDGVYGSGTADAVLAYKQKRNIVNRSYQTKADNIVGKMTVAALDAELLAAELAPLSIRPVHPAARFQPASTSGGSNFSFGETVPNLKPFPTRPPQAPGPDIQQQEVIIARGAMGTIQVNQGSGGKLIRSQTMRFYGEAKNFSTVAQVIGAQTRSKDRDELEIVVDSLLAKYEALNCGETFFQVQVSSPAQKFSEIIRLLSLVDSAAAMSLPTGDFSADPNFKSGLLTKQGTPVNPLPGRKINLFGEGESPGFEDYSSHVDFCTHTFSNGNGPAGQPAGHRPWTKDPRKPPGIPDKSVANICCRGSPIGFITIDEILRIGASKCRVTYAEASGRSQTDKIRAGLTPAGAKVIEEGNNALGGRAIILDLA